MKTIRLLSMAFLFASFIIIGMSFTDGSENESNEENNLEVLKADLRVSAIATPGGLCKGNASKVRVTVTNSQMAGVKEKIPVILYVSQNGSKPSSYVGYLNKGIGPNANYGLPVWFKNVKIPNTGIVTLKAKVNPDLEIQESNYNNNQKITKVKVAKVCGQAPAPATGGKLTVTAYEDGQWNYGNYTAIPSATVTVKKSNQVIATGSTGNDGKYTFNSIPKGYVKIEVSKSGCPTASRNYNMPTYHAKVNMALDCN
jgi:hypothetical protein